MQWLGYCADIQRTMRYLAMKTRESRPFRSTHRLQLATQFQFPGSLGNTLASRSQEVVLCCFSNHLGAYEIVSEISNFYTLSSNLRLSLKLDFSFKEFGSGESAIEDMSRLEW